MTRIEQSSNLFRAPACILHYSRRNICRYK